MYAGVSTREFTTTLLLERTLFLERDTAASWGASLRHSGAYGAPATRVAVCFWRMKPWGVGCQRGRLGPPQNGEPYFPCFFLSSATSSVSSLVTTGFSMDDGDGIVDALLRITTAVWEKKCADKKENTHTKQHKTHETTVASRTCRD